MNRTARSIRSAASSGSVGNLPPATLERLQSRFGLQVAACLNQRCHSLDADVVERLRHARKQALERARRPVEAASAPRLGATATGAALLGGASGPSGWWFKLASAVPALALVAGLLLIQIWQDSEQVSTAVEIDAALLADDLPPTAYSDEGFAEFLKTPPRD